MLPTLIVPYDYNDIALAQQPFPELLNMFGHSSKVAATNLPFH